MSDRVPNYAQGLQYQAQDDRLLLESLFGVGAEGIVGNDSFRCTVGGGTTGMSVTVGTGRAIVYSDVSFNGVYHTTGDASKAIDLGGSSSTLYRRDAIVARVRDATLVSGDGGSSFTREAIAGIAVNNTNPPLPTIPDRCLLLWDVLVNPNTTAPAKLTDHRSLIRPRSMMWQTTVTRTTTDAADQDTYKQVGAASVDQWPSWVQAGGAMCYHEVTVLASAIAASEVQFRTILGNSLNDAVVAGPAFYYKISSPGTFVYRACAEYVLPSLSTPFSQIQVMRVGSRRTALSFDQSQSVSVHRIQVVELPT